MEPRLVEGRTPAKTRASYVVGGANSAGQAALYFAKFASSVTMLVRGKGVEATMSKYLIDEIARTSNIVLQPETQVLEAIGEEHLERLRLSGPAGESEVPAGSLFVFIGAAPRTDWLPAGILRDEKGFLLAGPDLAHRRQAGPPGWREAREPFLLESSIPGVFVCGRMCATAPSSAWHPRSAKVPSPSSLHISIWPDSSRGLAGFKVKEETRT